jgi:hypothetical protein
MYVEASTDALWIDSLLQLESQQGELAGQNAMKIMKDGGRKLCHHSFHCVFYVGDSKMFLHICPGWAGHSRGKSWRIARNAARHVFRVAAGSSWIDMDWMFQVFMQMKCKQQSMCESCTIL